jgi:DNA-directed RNA polymerase specialized sigma24 family protein
VKVLPKRNGNVPSGQLRARNHIAKLTIETESSRFDALVTRYYPAVYSFASRVTDDPREAIALTRDAFNSTRKQLRSCSDENVFAAILISILIRACLTRGLN